jgi:2-polyprenyl-3-methyl-5-hydroxy-6-metoxy-1,4-benzoquinol methylase
MDKCGIEILQCNNCSLGYVEQVPTDLKDVYSDRNYLDQARRDYEKNIRYRMERFARERVDILCRWLDGKPEEFSLLDVGCGTGWFLEYAMQQGFTVNGQEYGKALADYTSDRLGVKIWSNPLAELSEDILFDAITLFDVLEHTADPLEMLTHVKRLLRPNGISLIFVPHLHSIGFAILQEESALVAPAEHLLYFTKNSMRLLAAKAGLEVLHIETKGMDIPDLIAYYRDKQNQPVVDFLFEHADLLQATIDSAGNANHMRVVLRNPA